MSSREFGSGCRNLGGCPRVQADRCRGDGYDCAYDACRSDRGIRARRMSLGPLMIDISGAELSPEDVDVLGHPLGGSVLLFPRNYRNPDQLVALTAAIRAVRSPHLMIAVDHEGGRVQRFREGFTKLPPSRPLGRRLHHDPPHALTSALSLRLALSHTLPSPPVYTRHAP